MQIGLVGATRDAELRADCYARSPDVTVAGIVAGTDQRLEWSDATRYPTVGRMLDDEDLDTVDVRDWRRPQRPIVERCLSAGAGVVCRTPLAHDVGDAVAIRDARTRTDRPIVADVPHRFDPGTTAAQRLVEAGDIGMPTTVRATRRVPTRRPVDGGQPTDRERFVERALSTDVAAARWLFGDVERVFTRWRPDHDASSVHHHAVAIVRFASGVVGHLDVSRGDRHPDVTVRTEYSGTEGRITYDSEVEPPIAVRSADHLDTGVTAPFDRPQPTMEAHDRHVAHLVDCVAGSAELIEPLSEALETARTVSAVTDSAARGEPVTVAEVGK